VKVLVAVDISDGNVVRLSRGEVSELTVYREDPVETALEWERMGAEWLHVVDIDAALRGEEKNTTIVEALLASVEIPVQVGGGIRSFQLVEHWLDLGATRVCIGTKALDEVFVEKVVDRFGDGVVGSVDARGGEVQVEGWQRSSGLSAIELAKRLEAHGVERLMFTDIGRDGTLAGPNIEGIRDFVGSVSVPVVASGGVDGEESLIRLRELEGQGLEGVVVGKALYTGAVTLAGAVKAARGY
jgi:phosphoribosylformimino-5-aminoimidazole carboxamide ribotide isomerase